MLTISGECSDSQYGTGTRNRFFWLAIIWVRNPFFFFRDDQGFAFASEVKSIFASGLTKPEIDLNGLGHYISLRFLPDRYSLFKGIQKLPAASWLLWKDGKITIERYWEPQFTNKLTNNESEIEEGLNSVLLESVKLHLLSDVHVGAFLSGGIDSSTIAAMMAKIGGAPIPTFSIGVKEQKFNELPYARMSPAHCN